MSLIYTGCTIAIAAFERFVHVAGVTPQDLVLVRIDLPDRYSAEKPAIADLPHGWDAIPPDHASMDYGSRWVRENRSLVLFVPFAILREETNAILNPNHSEFAGVKMAIERPFSFDQRLYQPRLPAKPKPPKR